MTLNDTTVTHEKALGNDFVSAGFSINRYEILSIIEPRYKQTIRPVNIGSIGSTIIIEPSVIFTIDVNNTIIGSSVVTVGLFDKSMYGTWKRLQINGDFNGDVVKSEFSMRIIEQPIIRFILDFGLDSSISITGLNNSQLINLDSLSGVLDLGQPFIFNSFDSSIATNSMDNVLFAGSYSNVTDNPYTNDSLQTNVVVNFESASQSGYIINGEYIASVYSKALNIVFGSNISTTDGERVDIRFPTNSLTNVFRVDLTKININITTGVISGSAVSNTIDNITIKPLFSYMEDGSVSITPDIADYNYILDSSSIVITSNGGDYDNTTSPYVDWNDLTYDIYGNETLTRHPNLSLLDIEDISITSRVSVNHNLMEWPILLHDNPYIKGDYIYTSPSDNHPNGLVTYLRSTLDLNAIDLYYFVDPVIYSEYEHGLLQQLATDLCLHPYGNRYTGDWTNANQKRSNLFLSDITVGNDRIMTMVYDHSSGTIGGWQLEDVGKIIRETNGNGEAIITDIIDNSNVRTIPSLNIYVDSGIAVFDYTTNNISGFGYVDGTYSINITSSSVTDTPAKIDIIIVNGSVDLGNSKIDIDNLGNFTNSSVLIVHYEGILSASFGHVYTIGSSQVILKETYDTATVNISTSFSTLIKKTSLDNPYDSTTPLFDPLIIANENWFYYGEWGVCINDQFMETQPYHLIYPNHKGTGQSISTSSINYYQQDHSDVTNAISTIGSVFIVESEKGTDLLSSLSDIVPGKSHLPSGYGNMMTSNTRTPQKWRIKFQYNDRDDSLSVFVSTDMQLLDNKNIKQTHKMSDGKGSSIRLPGELCEVSYDLQYEYNKLKDSFFNRRGRTRVSIENTYPMSYRLTCTDHGTALFISNQADVDRGVENSWFVIQRHVDQSTGQIDLEDGKSPVHCVYCPSQKTNDQISTGKNYFTTYLETPSEIIDGGKVITTKGLYEDSIYDVRGRKLTQKSPVNVNLLTYVDNVKVNRYSSGHDFTNNTYHDGTISPFSVELFNYANSWDNIVTDVSYLRLKSEGGDVSNSVLGTVLSTSGDDIFHGLQFPYNITSTKNIFDLWYENAPMDATAAGNSPNLDYYDPMELDQTSDFITMMENKVGKVGFNSINGSYEPVMLVNNILAGNGDIGPSRQGLYPSRIWAFEGDLDSGNNYGDLSNPVYEFDHTQFDIIYQTVAKNGIMLDETDKFALIKFDNKLTTFDITNNTLDIGKPLTSNSSSVGTEFKLAFPSTGTALDIVNKGANLIDGEYVAFFTGDISSLSSSGGAVYIHVNGGEVVLTSLLTSYLPLVLTYMPTTLSSQIISDSDGVFSLPMPSPSFGNGYIPGEGVTLNLNESFGTYDQINVFNGMYNSFDGPSKSFNFAVEYQWRGAGTNGIYVNPYGVHGDNTKPITDIAKLDVSINGNEIEVAPSGNINYIINGKVEWPSDYTYYGTSLNSYIYYDDKIYLRYEEPNGSLINLSYNTYSNGYDQLNSSFIIEVPEDKDIPDSWRDIHRSGRGIYRFVVRESDVSKPWDFHVSAVLPQVDSPAIINPMEQLSISFDNSFVFHFPTPMTSQRYIYPSSELDMICYTSANTSIQGGYTEVGGNNSKYDLDSGQYSSLFDNYGQSTSISPSKSTELSFRSPYTWHLDTTTYSGITNTTIDGINNLKSHTDHRTYIGMYATKPYGNGMRMFVQINGGSIRPEYSDN